MNAVHSNLPADAEPGYFGDPARARFGWLHRAAGDDSGVGLVIVPPFGYEAVCAQRSLRHLAEDAAAAGLTAVRFDLDGSGDSAGDDLDADRLDAWLASIDDACALARGAGANRLVLAGVRLGAVLATLAAAHRDDVAGLVAIAAVPTGKAFLREGRALQMALGLKPASVASNDDTQDLVGFALTAQTRAALTAVDLLAQEQPPAPRVLLLDRDDLAPNDAWANRLQALGAQVQQRRVPGYADMVLDPHRTVVPGAIIEATIAFALAQPPMPAPAVRTLALRPTASFSVDGRVIEEAPIRVDGALFGVISAPAAPARRGVLLLNAGAVARIGPNRLYVALARRLAARGERVLRLDLSGIGDSGTRTGNVENTVYSAHAIDDIGVAVDWLRRNGVESVVAVGLCSGAYHALQAALAGQPIERVVAINPLTFHYEPGMPLDFAAFRVAADAARYQRSMASSTSWKKLFAGQVDLRRVAKVLWLRASSWLGRPLRDLLRRIGMPLAGDLGAQLDALAKRGVALRFIFADDEPGRVLLAEQGGSVVPRLSGTGVIGIDVIDGADHTFTPRWSHPQVLDAIAAAIER